MRLNRGNPWHRYSESAAAGLSQVLGALCLIGAGLWLGAWNFKDEFLGVGLTVLGLVIGFVFRRPVGFVFAFGFPTALAGALLGVLLEWWLDFVETAIPWGLALGGAAGAAPALVLYARIRRGADRALSPPRWNFASLAMPVVGFFFGVFAAVALSPTHFPDERAGFGVWGGFCGLGLLAAGFAVVRGERWWGLTAVGLFLNGVLAPLLLWAAWDA